MEAPKAYAITTDVWMVPCRIGSKKRFYNPICKPLEQSKYTDSSKFRNSWKPEEDSVLESIVSLRGPKNWSSVAKELNTSLHEAFPVRKGKQCRERWFNHLNPKLVKTKWSDLEDDIIVSKQEELGNKWSEIAKFLIGRTENQVKNRWKSLKKKLGVSEKRRKSIRILKK